MKIGAPAEGPKAPGPLAGGPGSRVPRVPRPLGPGGLNHNGLLFKYFKVGHSLPEGQGTIALLLEVLP